MTNTCVAEMDTLIDVSPADITTAADWLSKLQLGFHSAMTWLPQSAPHRSKFQESSEVCSMNMLKILEKDAKAPTRS